MKPYEIDDWYEFLGDNNFENIQDMGEWVMTNCIFHDQTDTTRPSLGINKESGVGNCLGCGSHSWWDICKKLDISVVDLIEGTKEKEWDRFRAKILKTAVTEAVKFKRFKLPNNLQNPLLHNGAKAYIERQGFTKEILKEYNVKLCMDKTTKYYEHLIFPVEDERGILFFDARYVGNNKDMPRWQRPKKCAFWKTMWNWNKVKKYKTVFFVEGISDAIKLTMFGLPTIPMKHPSDRQFKMIINSDIENIILLYDNDEAGRWKKNDAGKPVHFTARGLEFFRDCGKNVIVAHLPKGVQDPAEVKDLKSLKQANKDLFKFVEIISP